MRADHLYTRRIYASIIIAFGSLVGAIGSAAIPGVANRPSGLHLALVGLLFVMFWPVFSLSLRRLAARQTYRAVGIALYAVAVVSLMVFGFAKPAVVAVGTVLAGPLPLLTFGLLLAWFCLELLALGLLGQATSRDDGRAAKPGEPSTVAAEMPLAA